jgi:hypothetical protein
LHREERTCCNCSAALGNALNAGPESSQTLCQDERAPLPLRVTNRCADNMSGTSQVRQLVLLIQ